jgi:hypothetical protein
MSLFAQGTYHRAPDSLFDGEWFSNVGRHVVRDPVYLDTYRQAQQWNYIPLLGWGCRDADAHIIRYMNAFARKIQRCWFNREELPMACPCPESP